MGRMLEKGTRVKSNLIWRCNTGHEKFSGKIVGYSRDKTCYRILRDKTEDPIVVFPTFVEKEV